MMDNEILHKVFDKIHKDLALLDFECNRSINELVIRDYIFSHEFAKSFFGDNLMNPSSGADYGKPDHKIYGTIEAWQYYLQQMILEEDPIKFLEKFL